MVGEMVVVGVDSWSIVTLVLLLILYIVDHPNFMLQFYYIYLNLE